MIGAVAMTRRWRVTLTWERLPKWQPRENGYLPYLLDRPEKVPKALDQIYPAGSDFEVTRFDLLPKIVRLTVVAAGKTIHRPPDRYGHNFNSSAQDAISEAIYAACFLSCHLGTGRELPKPVRIQITEAPARDATG
jgi:hypothetical protein